MHMYMREIIAFKKDNKSIMIMENTTIKYILEDECWSFLEVTALFLI